MVRDLKMAVYIDDVGFFSWRRDPIEKGTALL